jgi:hypothetical protein
MPLVSRVSPAAVHAPGRFHGLVIAPGGGAEFEAIAGAALETGRGCAKRPNYLDYFRLTRYYLCVWGSFIYLLFLEKHIDLISALLPVDDNLV